MRLFDRECCSILPFVGMVFWFVWMVIFINGSACLDGTLDCLDCNFVTSSCLFGWYYICNIYAMVWILFFSHVGI